MIQSSMYFNVYQITELWLLYSFPWKQLNPKIKFSSEWAPFVQENYLFYTRTLLLFLTRAISFDFYSSARPLFKTNQQQTRYLVIMERVLDCFNDDGLLSVLRAMESALCSLKTFTSASELNTPLVSSRIIGSPMSRTPNRTPITSRSGKLGEECDIQYQFRNSGPKTKSQITRFEGSFKYSPVFQTPENESESISAVVF